MLLRGQVTGPLVVGAQFGAHPELRGEARPHVWLTDFVGWLPMADGGAHEQALAADYNAGMHVEGGALGTQRQPEGA